MSPLHGAGSYTRGLHIATAVRPEMMDHEKFEVKVARNRELDGNVFDSEPEGLTAINTDLIAPSVRIRGIRVA